MKTVEAVYGAPARHWVGDGFPVRSLFTYARLGPERISPFLLLDHAGPAEFAPAATPRGVGSHPHRGFETVTLVYQGELAHRDSTGSGGRIGAGDVQWMTAGAGIVHEEFHSRAFTEQGGTLEMIQLWVNLRARDKSAAPAYQTLAAADIPEAPLDDGAGRVRVVAGECQGHRGPASTFTAMNVWDVRLHAGGQATLSVPDGHTTLLVTLDSEVRVNGAASAKDGDVVCFSRSGAALHVQARSDARLVLLTGEPIDEPVVGRGPFVMHSTEALEQAFADFRRGAYGKLKDE